MAFTTSDRFAVAAIGTIDINPSQINVYLRNTNGDEFRYEFAFYEHHTPESGTQKHTDWGILKEIWASADGFTDSNGDAITFYVLQNPIGHELTPAEHEARGYYNPLREGSYEAYVNRLEIDGALVTDGSLERDATTGHRQSALRVRLRLRDVDLQEIPSQRRYRLGRLAIQTTIYVGSG